MENNRAFNTEQAQRAYQVFWRAWLRLISPAHTPRQPEELRQTRLLGAILILMLALELAYQGLALTIFAGYAEPLNRALFIGTVVVLAAFWINRQGRLRAAAWATVAIMSTIIFLIAFDPQGDPSWIFFLDYLFIPLIVAAMILPPWSMGALTIAYLAAMGFGAWRTPNLEYEFLLMGPGFYIVVVAGVIALFNHQRTELEKDRRARLEANERRYRALFEGANDGIFLIDANRRLGAVNNKAAEMLGYPPGELVGMAAIEIVAPGDQVEAFNLSQALRKGQAVEVFEIRFRRKDGSIFPGEVTPALIHGDAGQPAIYQYIVRDISERKAAEARLQQQVKRLNALRRIDRMVAGGHPLSVTLETLLDETSGQLQSYATAILLRDPATGCLAPAAARGISPAAQAGLAAALASPPAWLDGDGRALRLPDGAYAAPLQVKGVLMGALWAAPPGDAAGLAGNAPAAATADWIEFLEMLAGQAAIAVDSAEMRQGLQKSHAELLASYDATLEGWARALELRDNETQGHSRRVTELAVSLASTLGMSDDELVHFRRGALLHDIGKMGIPDAILFKRGPLTHQEWDVMHMHPVYARDMLAPIPFLAPALEIPYAHHERWDGSGYPRGLRGRAIPWGARIFAVADAWDALTSDRPYRKAWHAADAWKYLSDQAGSLFDPEVVAALGRHMRLEPGE